MDYLNLGFGGSACGETVIAEYMAKLDMCMFVSDYDYNATDKTLKESHQRLYHIIREKNPDIPYIIITKPDYVYTKECADLRRSIIFETYNNAVKSGDKNICNYSGHPLNRK